MIKRYDKTEIIDDSRNEEIIKAILKKVIANGKGNEINISFMRNQLPNMSPSRKILKWYHELSGILLTIDKNSY